MRCFRSKTHSVFSFKHVSGYVELGNGPKLILNVTHPIAANERQSLLCLVLFFNRRA